MYYRVLVGFLNQMEFLILRSTGHGVNSAALLQCYLDIELLYTQSIIEHLCTL